MIGWLHEKLYGIEKEYGEFVAFSIIVAVAFSLVTFVIIWMWALTIMFGPMGAVYALLTPVIALVFYGPFVVLMGFKKNRKDAE